jgi:hypothetical protein
LRFGPVADRLPFGLDAFEFELQPAPRVVRAPRAQGGAERFGISLLETSAYCAALVIRNKA